MIYASHLIFKVRKWTPPLVRQPFSVRVMIPCYKEDIETLEETVECAVEAAKAAMAKGQINAGKLMTLQSDGCMRCVSLLYSVWCMRYLVCALACVCVCVCVCTLRCAE